MEQSKILHIKITRWITAHIPHQRLILLLSFIIGVLAGLAAVLMKTTAHKLTNLLTGIVNDNNAYWLYFVLPFAGILLTVVFVRIFVKEDITHGIPNILLAISRKKSQLKPHNMYSSMIASTFTVGLGGSVGLESPIVLTGSAIGSNIGQWFRMNYATTTLLVGCGAAGAIAGIFSAPIAAVVFALEVIMLDLTTASIIPLLLSSATATAVAWLLMGKGVLFSSSSIDDLNLYNLPYYIVLGIFSGFFSVYFTRITKSIERLTDKLGGSYPIWDRHSHRIVRIPVEGNKKRIFQRMVLGGAVVGLLIFLCPPLFGEGYHALSMILSNQSADLLNNSIFGSLNDNNSWLLLVFLSLVVLLKAIAMAVTSGSGGVGGIFAPVLFVGGLLGFILANIINRIPPFMVSENNFVMAGMTGVMAGVMHAPLTGIFLITEITGGHGLFIPLSLTAAFSFVIAHYIEPYSIYTSRLAKRGELITHDKDKAVLTLMKATRLIEKDFLTISPSATLGDLVKCISQSKRNIFPVVDNSGKLDGVVLLDDVRDVIFDPTQYKTMQVLSLMSPAPSLIETSDTMDIVMKKFEKTGAWNLPVVENGRYMGFLSKSKIFSAYRTMLQQFYED